MAEDGRRLGAAGQGSSLVFLRSAAKPFQALPLLENGGAERFRLTAADIALICSSHGGEPRHVRGVVRLLARRLPAETFAECRARGLVVRAMQERPEMVAGTRFFTTDFLRAGGKRWIGKEGAEGVYAVGLRASAAGGLAAGIALKIEDGSARARPTVTIAILRAMGWLPRSVQRALAEYESVPIENTTGAVVGSIEPELPIIRPDAAG